MTEPVKLTPEEEAVQEQIKALGLVEGSVVLGDEGTPPTEPAVAPPPTSAAPAAAPAPPAPTPPKDDSGTIKEWAEREKQRADDTRRLLEAEQAETKRLRAALGTPAGPAPTAQQAEVRQYLREVLTDGLLAEVVANLPEDVLDKHPSIRKRDMAIYLTRDDIAQTRFLGRFPSKDQPKAQRSLLPILQARRQASGYQKSYDELYDEYASGLKEQAELVGLTVSETPPEGGPSGDPPAPPSAPGPAGPVPPSLSGVRGGPGPATPQPATLSAEDARTYGLG